MNIQQLQYVVAVAELKHFEKAAERCFVTQSTLSTMIGRLENELEIKIFNRKTKPVSVTKEGEILLTQIKIILKEVERLNNSVQELKGEVAGELRIGIISTVAPYLLPLFLSSFSQKFPKVNIIIEEKTTATIQQGLKRRELDVGIVAISLDDDELKEYELYREPFVLFDCQEKKNTPVIIENIDYSRLILLEDEHCLSTQVKQICNISKNQVKIDNIVFKAGSIDSLIRFTKANKGLTLLPYLATVDMNEKEQSFLSSFTSPIPMRTIGIVVHQDFVKAKLLDTLQQVIQTSVNIHSPQKGIAYSPLK